MVTRQARIDAFHEGVPPTDQSLELLCEGHVGTYVIPFPCRWRSGAWQSAETGKSIEATVAGWRVRWGMVGTCTGRSSIFDAGQDR
jgi:hypothetical protein